jgi:uncharacterized protein
MSYALLILLAFFFILPATFKGGRMSLKDKENDIKDWLPSDFRETAELSWFADHFVGESFVLATWPGCTSTDPRLTLFQRKLHHESESYDPSVDFGPAMVKEIRRARQVGKDLQLILSGDTHTNWGGQNEKWIKGSGGKWYYILPNGQLYRWEETESGPAGLLRSIKKSMGTYELSGQAITAFGENETGNGKQNPFYKDPSLFTMPLFHTVQTGETMVDTLASPNGPLWPTDFTDPALRAEVARRRAMDRLTGILFAPAVPKNFAWTGQAIVDQIAGEVQDRTNLAELAQFEIDSIVQQRFEGNLDNLKGALTSVQSEVWYQVFDSIKVTAPARLTCVLVTLTSVAKENLGITLGRGVLDQPRGRLLKLAGESGLSAAQPPSMAPPPFNVEPPEQLGDAPPLRLGGPPVDNIAIDEEGTVTLVRLVGYSLLLGIFLSYMCFRSFMVTSIVFITGSTSAVLSMAIVYWTGGRVDAILMTMPSLVYVLGLSGAIHVINYYRDEVRARGRVGAASRALRHAFLPCALASGTTAIGLVSLYTSNLAPISNFGLYAAVGVMATLAILFSYLPAALQTFNTPVPMNDSEEHKRKASSQSDWWGGFGRTIARNHRAVSIAFLVMLLVGAAGLPLLQTSVQLLKLFDSESRIIRDYAWLEENFGKLVPMEVIVRMPIPLQAENPAAEQQSTSLDIVQRVEAISRVRRVIYQTLGEPGSNVVGQASASDTYLPTMPVKGGALGLTVRNQYKSKLEAASQQLRDNDFLRIEKDGPFAGSELWRISLRVAALSDVDYGLFIHTLKTAVDPVMRAYAVREEIVQSMANKPKDRAGKVLVLGFDRPKSIEETQLVNPDGSIASQQTLVTVLNDLLNDVKLLKDPKGIKEPSWYNWDAEKTKSLVSKASWSKDLASFDVVIWSGEGPLTKGDLAAAKKLINLRESMQTEAVSVLLPGKIPSVENGGPLNAIYTGVVPVIYKAQRTLLVSLTESIIMAFVLIALVMAALINPGRSLKTFFAPRNLYDGLIGGLVAMIPNVFPLIVVFGAMCFLGIRIDIGTMMVASVAMGVAVDDTIHFLAWYRDHLDKGMGREDAVIETFRRVGSAMVQTTIVGGLGLFVFALSTFTPTQRFGTLMLTMLVTALAGDLLLLPALLTGPLGKYFKPRVGMEPAIADDAIESNVDLESSVELEPEQSDAEETSDQTRMDEAAQAGPPRLRIVFPSDDDFDSGSQKSRAK